MNKALARTAALSIDDFALFARVAELRNLSAVAREREVPPSQVSRALARIEKLCGARLVHRTTHGLSLSEEGDSLAAHGVQVLAAAQALDADLDERRGEASGLVRVATSPVMALLLLPSLEPLLALHPRLRLEIAADDRLVDMARDGIDIAIRTGSPTSDGLVARAIGQHRRAIYAAPQYLANHSEPQHPNELSRKCGFATFLDPRGGRPASAGLGALTSHRLIGNSASPVLNRWGFEVDGRADEIKVSGTLRTDNTAIVLAMALAGLGIARLNRSVAAPHLAAGRLRLLLAAYTPSPSNPIYALMLPDRQRLPKVRVCVDHFAAWMAQTSAEEGG